MWQCHLAKNRGLPWWRHIVSSKIPFPSNSKSTQRNLFSLYLQAFEKTPRRNHRRAKKVLVIAWSRYRRKLGVLFSPSGWPLKKYWFCIYLCMGMKLNIWLQKIAILCQGKWSEGLLHFRSQEQLGFLFSSLFFFVWYVVFSMWMKGTRRNICSLSGWERINP